MAQAPRLDFEAFITKKKAELPKQEGAPSGDIAGHEYTYSFDRQSRIAFENTRPVALAVNASVRLFKQMGQHDLLGHAVKVSERQFPRIHRITARASEVLGIQAPQVFIVNKPTFNAGTLGTNDDSFIIIHSALLDQYSDEELLTVIGHECG